MNEKQERLWKIVFLWKLNNNMGKRGYKAKPTCSKGHDISIVGRTKSGNCKQCQSDYYRVRREFIRNNFPKEVNKNNESL